MRSERGAWPEQLARPKDAAAAAALVRVAESTRGVGTVGRGVREEVSAINFLPPPTPLSTHNLYVINN